MQSALKIHVAVLMALATATSVLGNARGDLNTLTGNLHTRVIWLQGSSTRFNGGKLMSFDSKTGQINQVLANDNTHKRPLLHNGGHSIIITTNSKVYTLPFTGGSPSFIVDGQATDVWKDPATGKEWVVVHQSSGGTGPVSRYMISDPSKKVALYTKAEKPETWYQVSGDGKVGVAFLPWSTCYYLDNGAYASNTPSRISGGCWSSVAPDNSHYWFHLTCCPHKTLKVFREDNFLKEFAMNPPVPSGTRNDEFYHPKFASKGARFLVITAGYHGNSSSDDAEVYVGKFASDYRSYEGWARITANSKIPDYFPEAWVGVENLGPPELTFVALTAASQSIEIGKKVSISVQGQDQSGNIMSIPGTLSWSASGGGTLSGKSSSGATFTSNGTPGTFTVTASAGDVKGTIEIAVIDPSQLHLRINSGGPDVSAGGVVWESGAGYVSGGKDYSFGGTHDVSGVSSPAPNEVYQTVHHQDHTYSFPDVPNGTYTVRLHFTDTHEGDRAMDYTIEGTKVLDDFNIVSAAGGTNAAVVKEFAVEVSDGDGLRIEGKMDQGNDVFEAGIEVIAGAPVQRESITLTEPNGGETYSVGEEITIRWSATEGISGVTIEVSADNGKTWKFITRDNGLQSSDPDFGAYPWAIPESIDGAALTTESVLIKVADYFDASRASDRSEQPFTIAGSGEVLTPGGVVMPAEGIEVHWDGSRGAVSFQKSGRYRVRLFDPAGRAAQSLVSNGGEPLAWDLSMGASGTYFLRVEGPAGSSREVRLFSAP